MSKFKVTSDLLVNTLCAITISGGVLEYSTNIFLNDKYVKYFKELNINGKPVLTKSLRKQYDDAIHDLKLTDFQKTFSTPFVAKGLNPVNVGSLKTRSGCYIGIPSIYDFDSNDNTSIQNNMKNLEIQEHVLLLNDNSEYGQQFMDSLILSDPAKKYSIAREIILADNHQILFKSISPTITLMVMYILGTPVLTSLPANPVKPRALAFFLLCNVGVFMWYTMHTAIEKFYQILADKKLCDIGEKYIRGGIEYYEKLIQRNLALRNIIPNGSNIYSEHGNKQELIPLFSELSLTHRKEYLEHRLKSFKNENNETLI